jgi:outer membrane lipoprotein carrier protein
MTNTKSIGKHLLLLVLVMSWSNVGHAWTSKEITAGIQYRYRDIKDLQADFHQKTTLPVMNRSKEASGKLYLRIPGKMRWDYLEGQKKSVIINDQTLWFYEPDENQVTVTDLTSMPDSDKLMTFLTGMGELERDFLLDPAPSLEATREGHVILHLFPRGESSQWKRLRLLVDPRSFQVVQTAFEGVQGDLTVIDYTNIRTNQGLGDELFNFEIPEGTDVLHYPPRKEKE